MSSEEVWDDQGPYMLRFIQYIPCRYFLFFVFLWFVIANIPFPEWNFTSLIYSYFWIIASWRFTKSKVILKLRWGIPWKNNNRWRCSDISYMYICTYILYTHIYPLHGVAAPANFQNIFSFSIYTWWII